MMTFDDEPGPHDYLCILKQADRQREAASRLKPVSKPEDDIDLARLDREIILELRRVARTKPQHWVSQRVMLGLTKRVRFAWKLADERGLRNCGDRFTFARRVVSERIEVLAQAGAIHAEIRYTPTGLERPGFVIPMFDFFLTQTDRAWLAGMHVLWE